MIFRAYRLLRARRTASSGRMRTSRPTSPASLRASTRRSCRWRRSGRRRVLRWSSTPTSCSACPTSASGCASQLRRPRSAGPESGSSRRSRCPSYQSATTTCLASPSRRPRSTPPTATRARRCTPRCRRTSRRQSSTCSTSGRTTRTAPRSHGPLLRPRGDGLVRRRPSGPELSALPGVHYMRGWPSLTRCSRGVHALHNTVNDGGDEFGSLDLKCVFQVLQ
mmetsp:Transcript_18079/g.41426  ORF Transcript_18079/g.41426 Transcript_18079/m.41426 type:complete len:222 (+) Transcript_18079:592-1257(+)